MKRKVSLKTLLFLSSLPAVVLPLLLLAVLWPWSTRVEVEQLEKRIEEDLLQNAILRVNLIEGVLGNAEDAVADIAVAWPAVAREPSPNQVLEEMVYRSRGFSLISVLSPEGRVRYSSEPKWIGVRVPDQKAWAIYKKHPKLAVSSVLRTESGRWRVRIVSPLRNGEALAGLYDVSQLQKAFQIPQTWSSERDAVLVDQDGIVIAHTDPRRIGENLSTLPPVQRALSGYQGAMTYVMPGSPERSASYVALPSLGWALVLTQPAASTMIQPIRFVEAMLFAGIAASILLAWLISTMLGQRLAAPITRISDYLQQIASEEVRPERVRPLQPSGILEPDRMLESAEKLYQALSETIMRLEARSSELGFANQQLAVTVEDLKRLDRLRTDFLNVLSHDLRIPLTVMLGYAEILQESPRLDPDEQTHIEAIMTAAHRMETMLNELLDYARLEAGQLRLELQPVDLGEMVEEMRAFFQPLADQKRLALHAETKGPSPQVSADPERLRQVISNLVSNAIKYTPAGGCVVIRTCTDDGKALVEVSDTGVGLSKEDEQHLFERFYRSKRPEVQQEKGTGLGLVITKGIIGAHHGVMEVESELGRGSTFRFMLPLAEGDGAR